MQKDSLPTRILKIILAVLVTVLAVSAVTALLLYGLVLAAVALVLLFILSPEDLRAFVKAAGERIDGWIGRLEGLWRSVKEGLDAWGARAMSARPLRQGRATGFPLAASLRKRHSAGRRKRHRKEADSAGSRLFFVSRSAVRLQLESL